ncbi:15704_t:CDS:2, partial [Acaulospora colombiana]
DVEDREAWTYWSTSRFRTIVGVEERERCRVVWAARKNSRKKEREKGKGSSRKMEGWAGVGAGYIRLAGVSLLSLAPD